MPAVHVRRTEGPAVLLRYYRATLHSLDAARQAYHDDAGEKEETYAGISWTRNHEHDSFRLHLMSPYLATFKLGKLS